MPKVPTYQLRVGAGSSDTALNAINLSTPYARAVSDVGNMLQQRGAQLLQQYDHARALVAFNTFRDSARGKLQELRAREGLNAQGIQGEYDEWARKESDKVTKEYLTAQTQQDLFKQAFEPRRAADLDNLAGHEINQLNVVRKDAIDGLAKNTDADIRASAHDEKRVKEMIGGFEAELYKQFPGMDHTATVSKHRQAFRVAQMEELIDQNPKSAALKLEEVKSDLGHAYHPLKKRLEAEQKEHRTTIAYNTMARMFPNAPVSAINKLRDEGFVKKTFPDLKLEELERVVNAFKAEHVWNEQLKKERKEELRDATLKTVIGHMNTGNIKAAEEALYRSSDLDPFHLQAMQNYIYTAKHRYDDEGLIKDIEARIENGDIKNPSQIEIFSGHGVSEKRIPILKQQLKDKQDNPFMAGFVKDAEEYYDNNFKDVAEMQMIKPRVMARLREAIKQDGLKGEAILQWMIDYVGTQQQLGKAGFLGMFGDTTSEAPVGKDLEAQYKTMRGEKGTSGAPKGEGVEAKGKPAINTPQTMIEAAQKMRLNEIPEKARITIVEQLNAAGKPATEQNIVNVFKANREKLLKYE